MTDTTWNATISASDKLSDSRSDINANFSDARKVTVTAIDNTDSPYVPADSDVIECDTSSGSITVNLPQLSSMTGQRYTFVKTSASNTLTLDGNASETINGATTKVLSTNYDTVTIVAGASEWLEI